MDTSKVQAQVGETREAGELGSGRPGSSGQEDSPPPGSNIRCPERETPPLAGDVDTTGSLRHSRSRGPGEPGRWGSRRSLSAVVRVPVESLIELLSLVEQGQQDEAEDAICRLIEKGDTHGNSD